MTSNHGAGRPKFRLVGLDGLRAVAVLAVIGYHADVPGMTGGFLGVDVFFVISGFLITTLLLREYTLSGGRIGLADFYRRRIRRLVPGMLAVVGVCLLASTWIWTDSARLVRRDAVASAFYVMNWVGIFGHVDYFTATGRPSMLQHLWSLAVEEQFYLVWPLVLLIVLRRPGPGGRRPRRPLTKLALRRTLLVALCIAAGSTLLMAILAVATNVPYGANGTRLYFGTDTHAMGLMTGAALAAANALFRLARGPRKAPAGRPRRWALSDGVAVLAGAGLLWSFEHVNAYSVGLYRGGFWLVSLVTAVLLVCAIRRGSATARLLETRPFVWVGRRSYALYLWHWPVVVVTRPGLDLPLPWLLVLVLRLALTVALAEASYRWVEVPFRSGGVHRWLHPGVRTTAWLRHGLLGAATVGAAALLILAVGAAPAPHGTSAEAAQAHQAAGSASGHDKSGSGRAGSGAHGPSDDRSAGTSHGHPGSSAPDASGKSTSTSTSPGSKADPKPARPKPPAVSAYGDSVMLGAWTALTDRIAHLHITAVEGAQAPAIFDAVLSDKRAGRLGATVVIHTGNNGVIQPSALDSLLDELADRRRVVLVEDHVDRDWAPLNNTTITESAHAHPNVRVLDWEDDSKDHADWFYPDGLHLSPTGQKAYAQLVEKTIKEH